MSRWPGCGGAAESRRGEVPFIWSKSGVEETSVLWCFFNLFGVLIPIDERSLSVNTAAAGGNASLMTIG
nr:hypothetical protein [Shigella flexneri]